MRFLRPLLLTALLVVPVAGPVLAQSPAGGSGGAGSNISFGARLGYTSWGSLNQVHAGFGLKLGEVLPNVRFAPIVEAGFGDDFNVIAVNADMAYDFTEFVEHPWNVYGGGGIGFTYLKPKGLGSSTDLGLSALLGLERTFANEHQGLVEIRVGLIDSPDFKLTFGYTLF